TPPVFGVVYPRQQAFGLNFEGLLGAQLRVDNALAQSFVGSSPHALWLWRKRLIHTGIAAKALSDLVGAPQHAIPCAFALAGVGQAITMPAQEIAPRSVQFGDAPAAGDPVHNARADEIRPRTAEAAGHADNADGLGHVLPFAAADTHAIREMQPVVVRSEERRVGKEGSARTWW